MTSVGLRPQSPLKSLHHRTPFLLLHFLWARPDSMKVPRCKWGLNHLRPTLTHEVLSASTWNADRSRFQYCVRNCCSHESGGNQWTCQEWTQTHGRFSTFPLKLCTKWFIHLPLSGYSMRSTLMVGINRLLLTLDDDLLAFTYTWGTSAAEQIMERDPSGCRRVLWC